MKKLFTFLTLLVCLAASAVAADYVPKVVKTFTKSDNIVYAADITGTEESETSWVVVPDYSLQKANYTNTTSDTKGNPNGLTDNISSASNVNMIQMNHSITNYTEQKKVIHMHVKGITGVIGHAMTSSSGRGMTISCTEYKSGLSEFASSAQNASFTRSGSNGSFIVKLDNLDPEIEYVVSFFAAASGTNTTNFYCAEFLLPEGGSTGGGETEEPGDEPKTELVEYIVYGTSNGAPKAGEVLTTTGKHIKLTANYAATANGSNNSGKKFYDGTASDFFCKSATNFRLKENPSSSNVKGTPNAEGHTSYEMVVNKTVKKLIIYYVGASPSKEGDTRKVSLYNHSTSKTTDYPGEFNTENVSGNSDYGYLATVEDLKEGTYTLFCRGFTGGFCGIKYYVEEEVKEPSNDPMLTVDPATVNLTVTESGSKATQTITVSGENLTGDAVTVSLADEVAGLSVDPATITITDGKVESTTVTLTYEPTANAEGATTLTIAAGDTQKTVTVNYKSTVVNEGGDEPVEPSEVIKWYVDGAEAKQTVDNYFTVNHPENKPNYNGKYTGSYDGVDCTAGLKLDTSTSLTFTTEKAANIVIVQSLSESKNLANSIKFDDVTYTQREDNPLGSTNAGVYTFEKVVPGTHIISRGSSEIGIFYVSVTYIETDEVYLTKPEITFDAATGEVTITADEKATKVMYTTDKTVPSAKEGNEYKEPFTVTDGTVVKAIAIGNGENIIDSEVATTEPCLLTSVEIATPVVSTFNGAVGISCSTLNTKLEYRFDEGSDWTEYTRPFNLADGETKTIYVKASRGENEPATTEAEVKGMAPNTNKTRTVFMGYGAFNAPTKEDGYSTLVGKDDNEAPGYKLVLVGDASKAYASGGNDKIQISLINDGRTTIKGSNGAQNKLVMPDGVLATRVYLYSIINAASGSRVSGWKEVNGVSYGYDKDAAQTLGAWSNVTDRFANPDLRVYDLCEPGEEGVSEFTFTNAGELSLFVIAVDVIDPQDAPVADYVDVTIGEQGLATLCSAKALNIDGAELVGDEPVEGSEVTFDVWTITGVTVSETPNENNEYTGTFTMAKVETTIPAEEGVIVHGRVGRTYRIPFATEAENAPARAALLPGNMLQGTLEDITHEENGDKFVLEGFKFVPSVQGETLPAGSAYLKATDDIKKASVLTVAENNGPTTGVENVTVVPTMEKDVIYDLYGRRVEKMSKGIYIINGSKVIIR
ncbi:MAG: chitobiase/beta-hexosaminidase C-terminal domain-containing protein [Muribaculaceae bacterium]|nr:chitobiase/beta-hexosaminidase C-terminal domain-containing protein [Muribaculaceae bacterium]